MKLNKEIVKCAYTNVPFIHQLTPEGLKLDPRKIEANVAIPEPEDPMHLGVS